jgi:hypothetical protein
VVVITDPSAENAGSTREQRQHLRHSDESGIFHLEIEPVRLARRPSAAAWTRPEVVSSPTNIFSAGSGDRPRATRLRALLSPTLAGACALSPCHEGWPPTGVAR